MVITVKHSGSLVTLSSQGFAAKNSLANAFTAGGEALLLAHFKRVAPDDWQRRLEGLRAALGDSGLAISFELVTGE